MACFVAGLDVEEGWLESNFSVQFSQINKQTLFSQKKK
jgi:hypothetical protein